MKTLAVIEGCPILLQDDGRVTFTADADIDADGANGQNGQQAAYMVNDVGSEYLANGGMQMNHGRVVSKSDWYRDIVILNEDGGPKAFGDVIASKTSYEVFPGVPAVINGHEFRLQRSNGTYV